MHALTQLQLDRQQSRTHPLGYSPTLHLEFPILASSADVRQSQEIERLGWSLSMVFPILFGKSPELDQPCFLWM